MSKEQFATGDSLRQSVKAMLPYLRGLEEKLAICKDAPEVVALRTVISDAVLALSIPSETPRMTTVEFCGKPAAAPCAIEEQCQYGADRNQIIEECALVCEELRSLDSFKTANGGYYAAAARVRALKTNAAPQGKDAAPAGPEPLEKRSGPAALASIPSAILHTGGDLIGEASRPAEPGSTPGASHLPEECPESVLTAYRCRTAGCELPCTACDKQARSEYTTIRAALLGLK